MSERSPTPTLLYQAREMTEVLDRAGLADEADAVGIADSIVCGDYYSGYEMYLQHSGALLAAGHVALDADLPADMRQTWRQLDARLSDLHIERMTEACDIADTFVRTYPALLYCRSRYGQSDDMGVMQVIHGFGVVGADRPRQASLRALTADKKPVPPGRAYCDVAVLPMAVQSKISSYLLEL